MRAYVGFCGVLGVLSREAGGGAMVRCAALDASGRVYIRPPFLEGAGHLRWKAWSNRAAPLVHGLGRPCHIARVTTAAGRADYRADTVIGRRVAQPTGGQTGKSIIQAALFDRFLRVTHNDM
jgi:hypothetical protein